MIWIRRIHQLIKRYHTQTLTSMICYLIPTTKKKKRNRLIQGTLLQRFLLFQMIWVRWLLNRKEWKDGWPKAWSFRTFWIISYMECVFKTKHSLHNKLIILRIELTKFRKDMKKIRHKEWRQIWVIQQVNWTLFVVVGQLYKQGWKKDPKI